MRALTIAIVLAAGAVSAAPARWPLRFDGAGPLRIGMSYAQASAALGVPLTPTPPNLRGSVDCDVLGVPGRPHFAMVFIRNTLVRVDEWDEPNDHTERGLHIGDSEDRLRALYPHAEREDHAYAEGFYYTVRDPKRDLWLRIETDRGRVTSFYSGTHAAVQLIEGCL